MVTLGEKIKELERQNQVLETEVVQLKHKGGRSEKAEKSELRSTKKLYPEKFVPGKEETFRSWAVDFLIWVKAEDAGLADKLKAATHEKKEIPMPPAPAGIDVRFVFNHLRKLMGDKESRSIVRAVGLGKWP